MYENRDVIDTLDRAWELLRIFPKEKLTKIKDEVKAIFYHRAYNQLREDENRVDNGQQDQIEEAKEWTPF